MNKSRKIICSQCGHALEEFEPYTVIDGDVYCQEHADEWIKDYMQENFEKYRDSILDMIGLPALEAVYG